MDVKKKKKNICTLNIDCTGCRACEQICPKLCISMEIDCEGFLSPRVDSELCICCGKCLKICPQYNDLSLSIPISVYAAFSLDKDILHRSASGGIFFAVARQFIENGGIVFGCQLDDNLVAEHVKVIDLVHLCHLQGSKYVQSNVRETYSEVLQELENDKDVLYSGTPCQIAGLYSFLGRKWDNLYTIDLLCHGVPSPTLYKKYIEWLSIKLDNKVIQYEFRNKDKIGWKNGYRAKITTKNKEYYRFSLLDPYYYAFTKSYTYRECCYRCKYSQAKRLADITLADYWGIEKCHPDFVNSDGVSLVICTTEKGQNFFKMIKSIEAIPSTLELAMPYNHNLRAPTIRPEIRDSIYNGLLEDDLEMFFEKKFNFSVPFKKKLLFSLPVELLLFLRKIKKYINENIASVW